MKIYICPMHPEIREKKPGKCPKCGGMELIEVDDDDVDEHKNNNNYSPLYTVISLIALVSCVSLLNSPSHLYLHTFLNSFMTGFFIVFAGFKLLDIDGFAHGFSSYDLLAKRFHSYGYIYPYLELGLGLLYLTGIQPPLVNIATFVLMTFSGIGVFLKLRKKEKFACVCLGTFLKVPLTKVTLIENFGMAAMALVMIFFFI